MRSYENRIGNPFRMRSCKKQGWGWRVLSRRPLGNSLSLLTTRHSLPSPLLSFASSTSSASSTSHPHVITTAIEHEAVLNACQALEKQGVAVTFLPVDRNGHVNPEAVRRSIRPETALITVMHANNELGTVQPL